MAGKSGSTQKGRSKKTSEGIHGGGGRVRNLTHVQKVLLGGGLYRTWKPLIPKS